MLQLFRLFWLSNLMMSQHHIMCTACHLFLTRLLTIPSQCHPLHPESHTWNSFMHVSSSGYCTLLSVSATLCMHLVGNCHVALYVCTIHCIILGVSYVFVGSILLFLDQCLLLSLLLSCSTLRCHGPL